MIKISFPEPDSEQWEKWRQKCRIEQLALNDSHSQGEPRNVSKQLYRELRKIYLSIDGPFHGKCAYCETFIAENHPGDLDHFRPKQGVTVLLNPVTITDAHGIERLHPGYYWLTYDYQKLLPACEDCNRPSKWKTQELLVGKGTEFPVAGFRACHPGEEIQEIPLLINPVADIDAEQHMEVQPSGLITPLTDRGITCCTIFGLNLREGLIIRRREAYDLGHDTVFAIMRAAEQNNAENIQRGLKILQEFKLGIRPYSAAGRAGIRAAQTKLQPLYPDLFE